MNGQKKILIIEDEKALRLVFKHKLEHEGFIVDTAETLELGEELLSTNTYDVISTDLIINSKSGFEILKKFAHLKTPIVVTSSLSQESDKGKAAALGAKAYLSKIDLSISDIIEEIKKLL